MMAFFNSSSKKSSKLLMVTVLIMALVVTYAIPMTVFADDIQQEQSQEQLQDPGTGADDPGTGTEDPGTGNEGPGNGDEEPGTGTEDPGNGDEDQGTGTEEPGTGTEDPDAASNEGVEGEEDSLGEQMMMAPRMIAPMITASSHGTSGDGIIPDDIAQNELPDMTGLSSYKVSNNKDGQHQNDDGFTVTLKHYDDEQNPIKVDWSSNWDVKYVVVKGQGRNHLNLYDYGSGDNSDTGLMAALNNKGEISTINYVEFYYNVPQMEYGISLEKTVSPEKASPGDKVTYKFKVTNTGQDRLYHIKINDSMINDFFLYQYSLNSGESKVFTADYIIPLDTPLNSVLTNTATVTGKDCFGNVKATATDTADLTVAAEYAISLIKTVDASSASPEDTVTYTFVIKNTGLKDLKNIVLKDSKLGAGWKKQIDKLSSGQEVSFSETHIIPSNAPLNADYINTATVEGEYKVKKGFMYVTKKVSAQDTATVYVTQEQPQQETVQFFVRNGEYPRPTTEGSQPVAHFTGLLGTLTIDVQTPKPAPGYSLINEFAPDADENIVENKVKELGSTDSYIALMNAINAKMEAEYSSFLPGEGATWYIDWYDFKWENDGWHVDGDIVIINDEEPGDTEFNYTVYYKVIETNELLHTLTGTAIMGDFPLNIPEPDVVKNNSSYKFYSNTHGETADVTFNMIIDVTDYVATVWYEPVSDENGENDNPTPRPGPRNRSGGSTTIVEEPVPAAPVTPEEIDGGEIILDDEIPAGPLPKTGGLPSLLLYGLGALLMSGGTAMKLKNKNR